MIFLTWHDEAGQQFGSSPPKQSFSCEMVTHHSGGPDTFDASQYSPLTTANQRLPPQGRGTWVAQVVEHPTPGFSLSHGLRMVSSSPESDSALNTETA